LHTPGQRIQDQISKRPFAIVIVAGLISRLFIGFFVNPVLYEMVAREGDVLQV
jgi:cobalt-zinc-cadmium resistance protein CzcA